MLVKRWVQRCALIRDCECGVVGPRELQQQLQAPAVITVAVHPSLFAAPEAVDHGSPLQVTLWSHIDTVLGAELLLQFTMNPAGFM